MLPTFPYVPKVMRDYLRENVPEDWRVVTVVPKPKPPKLVTISSVPASGSNKLVLSTRRLVFQGWNSNELYCGRMAEHVRALCVSAPRDGVMWIRGVTIVGEPADFRDPDNPAEPRFQITADFLVRAHTDANPDPFVVV